MERTPSEPTYDMYCVLGRESAAYHLTMTHLMLEIIGRDGEPSNKSPKHTFKNLTGEMPMAPY